MWKNLKFSLKISILVFVLITFSLITALGYHILASDIRDMGIKQSRDTMLQGYKNELKDIVDVMALSLSSAVQGVNDEKEIHDIFTKLVSKARFFPDKSGYYFIYKLGGIVFVHASNPNLEGKNLIDLKDPDGKFLIQELENVSRLGGGYVDYWWDKPGKGLQPKLSYSRMIPDKPYWIGSGVYIDDVKKKEDAIFKNINEFSTNFLRKFYIVLSFSFLAVVAPLTFILIRSIVIPLTNLTHAADQFSIGQLDMDLPDLTRKDEIGKLARAMNRLGTSITIAMQKIITMRQASGKKRTPIKKSLVKKIKTPVQKEH